MIGNIERLENIDQFLETLQVRFAHRLAGAQRQSNPVQTQRIFFPRLGQEMAVRAAAEIIFRVNFEPSQF